MGILCACTRQLLVDLGEYNDDIHKPKVRETENHFRLDTGLSFRKVSHFAMIDRLSCLLSKAFAVCGSHPLNVEANPC